MVERLVVVEQHPGNVVETAAQQRSLLVVVRNALVVFVDGNRNRGWIGG